MRRKLVAGNWKSNGNSQFVVQLLDAVRRQESAIPSSVDVAVCPPVVYVSKARELLKGSRILLGAQDVSPFSEGAYTGEVSAAMLSDVGCDVVIVGHSERRGLFGESNAIVKVKLEKAFESRLKPILCVGETLAERRQGHTLRVCGEQLETAVADLDKAIVSDLVVAYEPVWAIGTGETASADQVQEVHKHLREVLAGRFGQGADGILILYGGSVKAANAQELFALPDVDGGLIGGASLVAEEFLAICKAAGNIA